MRFKASLLALMAVLVASAFGALLLPHEGSAQPALHGTILPNKPAPAIRLADQFGTSISLARFRGRPVIITFLESHCTESCPLVAETIRRVADSISASSGHVPVLIISTDPEGDRPSAVGAFLRAHHLSHGWHYLTGTRSQLAPVWSAYKIFVPPPSAPAAIRDSHTSATFLVDRNGLERVLLTAVPDARFLLRDLRLLSGLPAGDQKMAAGVVPSVGQAAPQVAMRSLDGSARQLRSLTGKVVLLNFWATWCPPCRSELPLLSTVANAHRSNGLRVIGVDKLEDAATVRSFVRDMHLPYSIVLDPSGALWGTFQPLAVPETFVIDRTGTIRAIRHGALDKAWIQQNVIPLLGNAG